MFYHVKEKLSCTLFLKEWAQRNETMMSCFLFDIFLLLQHRCCREVGFFLPCASIWSVSTLHPGSHVPCSMNGAVCMFSVFSVVHKPFTLDMPTIKLKFRVCSFCPCTVYISNFCILLYKNIQVVAMLEKVVDVDLGKSFFMTGNMILHSSELFQD